jgi:hypothetical protein
MAERVRQELIDRINLKLQQESQAISNKMISARDIRSYICSIPNCERQGYAKGYCHAHYVRSRTGKDLNSPLQNRKSGATCILCEKELKGKGGWNMCSNHYKQYRFLLIKEILIDHLGGKCNHCEKIYPYAVFDFHHLGNKEEGISYLISNAGIEQIVNEVSKCILLCANCHRIEHIKNDIYGRFHTSISGNHEN